jgi:CubicO group peptidase (beta-lactamase class C family)
MKSILTKSFLIITIFFIHPSLFAQQRFEAEWLKEYIQNGMEKAGVTGAAVGIIKNNQIVFSEGFGLRHRDKPNGVDAETIFGVASVSKAFTAACIGILVDEGKLNWDDNVINHLPWFQLYDPYVTSEITVRDLLCHRSGLGTFDGDLLWYATDYSRKEVVERIKHLPLKNSFRAKYGYQNVMYIAAGEVIEAVTGKSWDEFLRERIFEPLGMKSSSTTTSIFNERMNISYPHVNGVPQEFMNYDNAGPAASVNSSVSDLLKWLQMWLNNGKFEDQQILSEASVRTITSSQLAMDGGPGMTIYGIHFRSYGLGWGLMDYSGRKIIEHGGGLPGVHTRVTIVPEDSLGIVILTNELSGLVNPLRMKILDLFLNDKEVDYVTEGIEAVKKYLEEVETKRNERYASRIKGTSPSFTLSEYAGTYEDKMYGKVVIEGDKRGIKLTMLPTKELFTSELEHWHFNTFRIKFNDPFLPYGFVTFTLNADGKITGFTIDLPNPDFHFENLNFKKIF